MTHLRISEVAGLLRVSDDTVRRWVDQGRLDATQDRAGRTVVPGASVAAFVRQQDHLEGPSAAGRRGSARNRLPGIVT
ncbi:MAG TPA: helix-turn-helix domain-containing protein, partial [Jiangellales bacterium]|nr:helix-turn-helix domain-containing protein [Jiangellales bacterium]